MTEVEKKLYDYAVSVDWDCSDIVFYLGNLHHSHIGEYKYMEGFYIYEKVKNFIEKYKPKEPVMITLPIEDYNRLRKLEIKQEIKRLKRELKGL